MLRPAEPSTLIPREISHGSTQTSAVDRARERELYKYYSPDDEEAPSTSRVQKNSACQDPNSLTARPTSSPDTILTALAQLTAIRLKAQRAMISLIGQDTQYFVAESTKTLDLADDNKSEEEGDGLWLGCSSVSKEGRLCEVGPRENSVGREGLLHAQTTPLRNNLRPLRLMQNRKLLSSDQNQADPHALSSTISQKICASRTCHSSLRHPFSGTMLGHHSLPRRG